jgi:hypothetical protein
VAKEGVALAVKVVGESLKSSSSTTKESSEKRSLPAKFLLFFCTKANFYIKLQ